MNKKGFTLTELLAVIAILGVVMLIGSVSISAVRDKINKNMFEMKLEFVIAAAKTWGQDNKDQLSKDLSIGDLLASGDLESDERVSISEYSTCESQNKVGSDCIVLTNNFDGSVVNALKVRVYLEHNRVYACILKDNNNKIILNEKNDWSEYGHLNYYCS